MLRTVERRCWTAIAVVVSVILLRVVWIAAHVGRYRYAHLAWHGFWHTVVDPNYWAFLVALAALQWFWPGRREQRGPSLAIVEDATWFVFSTLLGVTIVVWVTNLFDTTFNRATGGWNGFNFVPYLGVWGVAIFAFVIGDFFVYVTHWLHHHTKTLWYFHAVHHSQENLNPLSDNRQHIVETIVVFAVTYVPGVALGLTSADALKLGFANLYFSAWLHTNLRTNLGPLRHVLASPQFHRVHHSTSPEHFNTNYATVFPIWDVLFHTRHKDVNSYPKTGIHDATFPHQVKASPQSMVGMFVRQTIHPFKLAVKRVPKYAGVDKVPEPTISSLWTVGEDHAAPLLTRT